MDTERETDTDKVYVNWHKDKGEEEMWQGYKEENNGK